MRLKLIITAMWVLLASGAFVWAQEGQDHEVRKVIEVGNEICPVSGDKLEKGGKMDDPVKYEYHWEDL